MTAPVDFAALPSTLVVPGIAAWLGVPEQPDSEPEETWEALCARISRTEAAS